MTGRHILTPKERPDYGVIVTAEVDGVVRVRQGYGLAVVALEHAVEQLEALGGPIKILAISTPDTIMTDLTKGSRLYRTPGNRLALNLPEGQMLARIGRSDLAPPTTTPQGERKRRMRLWKQRRNS